MARRRRAQGSPRSGGGALSFDATLSSYERRVVHEAAEAAGLAHATAHDGARAVIRV